MSLLFWSLIILMPAAPPNPQEILSLPAPPADARIAYGRNENQFGDLRLPSGGGDKKHPVVVVIHGGFWRAAYDLVYAGHMAADLAKYGFATWNIEYRRLGQHGGGYPGTLDDVAAAVDHLAAIAVAQRLDLSRVYALGHSAGGHLALWLATRKEAAVRIAGAVALAGIGDLKDGDARRLSSGVVAEWMGCAPSACGEAYQKASPIERLPAKVPLRLIHGDQDDIVPFAMSEAFVKAARRAGDDATLIRLAGSGHFQPVDPRTAEWKRVLDALRSLNK